MQLKTQKVDHFEEVTVGQDTLYSIPSVSLEHQGTYQCEIYSGQRSIVRVYYYLSGNRTHRPQDESNCDFCLKLLWFMCCFIICLDVFMLD